MEIEKSLTQVAKMAKSNHIWLNAFACIKPTDEYLMQIGRMIIQKLEDDDCLLKNEDTLSRMLYLSINKS